VFPLLKKNSQRTQRTGRRERSTDGAKVMSLLKRRVAATLAVVGLASLVTLLQVEASHETDDQIGTEAVWNASAEDLNEIVKVCKNPKSADYAGCFVEQMGGYASSEAVAFTQLLATQKPARLGYLDGMREAGLVDLGYVVYPGTKSKQGWVLMNGVPALINVDDLSMLPQSEMAKDAQFASLRKSHSQMQLTVTDDERSADAAPQIEPRANGGERFVIPYSLQETCNGCAPFAQASFGFDFDAAGQFKGVKFIKVTAEQP
jgi:hypothetical protein